MLENLQNFYTRTRCFYAFFTELQIKTSRFHPACHTHREEPAMPRHPDQSTENLIRRTEAAQDVAALKDVLAETLTLLMMVRGDIRELAHRVRALEESAPDQAVLEETRADIEQLLNLATGTPYERFALTARRCVYNEDWQEADTALAAFREPGELRDLALRIRGRLIDLYS